MADTHLCVIIGVDPATRIEAVKMPGSAVAQVGSRTGSGGPQVRGAMRVSTETAGVSPRMVEKSAVRCRPFTFTLCGRSV